jgi:hypothetical protein
MVFSEPIATPEEKEPDSTLTAGRVKGRHLTAKARRRTLPFDELPKVPDG